MLNTRHSPIDCECCAALVEADAIGAIPPANHKHEGLPAIAEKIAESIRIGDQRKTYVTSVLLEFAAEIKRGAIEP